MSGCQVSCSNTSSQLNHSKTTSFPPRTPPSWTQWPSQNRVSVDSHSRTCTSSNFSCSGPSGGSLRAASPTLPQGQIRRGRPCSSKMGDTNYLEKVSKVARRPACHSSSPQPPRDHASRPSSPTFLDHLIKGISSLDRSTHAFSTNCPKTMSLPRLATACLEQAASVLYADHLEQPVLRRPPSPKDGVAPSDGSTSMLLPSQAASVLQCLVGTNIMSSQQPQSQSFGPARPQRSAIKLPELPLFDNSFFSLSHLPKVWKAICSSWSAPKPISDTSSWW